MLPAPTTKGVHSHPPHKGSISWGVSDPGCGSMQCGVWWGVRLGSTFGGANPVTLLDTEHKPPGSWDAQRLPWALCDPVYPPTPNLHNPHWVGLRTGRAKKGASQPQMWWESLEAGTQAARAAGMAMEKGRQWWSQLVAPKSHPKPQASSLSRSETAPSPGSGHRRP